ncbi:hypothetical protein FXO38_36033 [Capsicum annuum]|nr:hypothetical protein FXO38_36033 [Capsicum annuum]
MEKLVEIGNDLLKKPVSRVNLKTGQFEQVHGEGTNENALIHFAKLLSEERKHRKTSKPSFGSMIRILLNRVYCNVDIVSIGLTQFGSSLDGFFQKVLYY